jgi:hypothetical protein
MQTHVSFKIVSINFRHIVFEDSATKQIVNLYHKIVIYSLSPCLTDIFPLWHWRNVCCKHAWIDSKRLVFKIVWLLRQHLTQRLFMKMWWQAKSSHTVLCAREIRAAVSLLTMIVMMAFHRGLFLVIEHTSESYVKIFSMFENEQDPLAKIYFLEKILQLNYCFFWVVAPDERARIPHVTNSEDHMEDSERFYCKKIDTVYSMYEQDHEHTFYSFPTFTYSNASYLHQTRVHLIFSSSIWNTNTSYHSRYHIDLQITYYTSNYNKI